MLLQTSKIISMKVFFVAIFSFGIAETCASQEISFEQSIADTIEHQDHEELTKLLDALSWNEYPKETPVNLLAFAASMGNITAIDALVNSGVDINATLEGGWTALSVALMSNQIETAQQIVLLGGNPFIESDEGVSPNDIAVSVGVELGEKTGSSKSQQGSIEIPSPNQLLISGILTQNKNEVVRALEAKADPDFVTVDGWPVVVLAAAENNEYAFQKLIDSGAQLETSNGDGLTVASAAILNNNHTVLEKILNSGRFDPDYRPTPNTLRAIEVAILEDDIEAVVLLVEYGAALKALSGSDSPHQLAMKLGNEKLTTLLEPLPTGNLLQVHEYLIGETRVTAERMLAILSYDWASAEYLFKKVWAGKSLIELAISNGEIDPWPNKPEYLSENVRKYANKRGLLESAERVSTRAQMLVGRITEDWDNFPLVQKMEDAAALYPEQWGLFVGVLESNYLNLIKLLETSGWENVENQAKKINAELRKIFALPGMHVKNLSDDKGFLSVLSFLLEKELCHEASVSAGSKLRASGPHLTLNKIDKMRLDPDTNILWAVFLLCDEKEVLTLLHYSDYGAAAQNNTSVRTWKRVLLKQGIDLFDAAISKEFYRLSAHLPLYGYEWPSLQGKGDGQVRKEIQQFLASVGFYSGEIDGVWGAGSRNAVDKLCLSLIKKSHLSVETLGIYGKCDYRRGGRCAHTEDRSEQGLYLYRSTGFVSNELLTNFYYFATSPFQEGDTWIRDHYKSCRINGFADEKGSLETLNYSPDGRTVLTIKDPGKELQFNWLE